MYGLQTNNRFVSLEINDENEENVRTKKKSANKKDPTKKQQEKKGWNEKRCLIHPTKDSVKFVYRLLQKSILNKVNGFLKFAAENPKNKSY